MEIIEIALLLEIAEDRFRILVSPVGKYDHVLAVVFNPPFVSGIDYKRTILARLFLETAVAVVPVSPARFGGPESDT
jgi:hypothetical protein